MQRRHFLHRATGLGLGSWITLGPAMRALASSQALSATPAKAPWPRLIVVMLRGAVDGLSVVVPYAETNYYRERSTIALARPGASDGVFDLDGRFGLHPALGGLLPLWQSSRLGFVQASGSSDDTRSHFDAQDYMESGTPGRKTTADGWLNRCLGALPGDVDPRGAAVRAVSLGPTPPRIYAGTQPVAYLAQGRNGDRPTLLDRPRVAQAFGALYAGGDRMAEVYRQGQMARKEVNDTMSAPELEAEMKMANNGAPLPNGFAQDATRLGNLMRKDPRVQLAFAALGGWDTHANQGAARGQLAGHLTGLSDGLVALSQSLGPVFDRTVVVVMSEFGRTMAQNGNAGTDHGHGNAMWLLGGPVRGGRVHGRWPGVGADALHEGRDLAVTTDFRWPLARIMEAHLRVSDANLGTVFPEMPAPDPSLDFLRA